MKFTSSTLEYLITATNNNSLTDSASQINKWLTRQLAAWQIAKGKIAAWGKGTSTGPRAFLTTAVVIWQWLSVWPWASHFPSLGFTFLICKMTDRDQKIFLELSGYIESWQKSQRQTAGGWQRGWKQKPMEQHLQRPDIYFYQPRRRTASAPYPQVPSVLNQRGGQSTILFMWSGPGHGQGLFVSTVCGPHTHRPPHPPPIVHHHSSPRPES